MCSSDLQFFRASLAAIAPELIADLALSPRMLGLANGAFFAALFVAQVFVGLFFDRVGVRRTVSALAVAMVVGSAMHAMARSGLAAAARVLEGGARGSQDPPQQRWNVPVRRRALKGKLPQLLTLTEKDRALAELKRDVYEIGRAHV